MKNIIFVLFHDFRSNSAGHAHNFANELSKLGYNCVVAVPSNKESASLYPDKLYGVINFKDIDCIDNRLFPNGRGPDIVHAWTPREIVRKFVMRLKEIYDFKLCLHLEDNEEHVACSAFNKNNEEIIDDIKLRNIEFPEHLTNPVHYDAFIKSTDGVTILMDKLSEFVPNDKLIYNIWPGYDKKLFRPMQSSDKTRRRWGIPDNHIVLSYTGNIHHSNYKEVRSLFLAVAILNREGFPTVLLKTGQDINLDFLGNNGTWVLPHIINLGFVDRHWLPEILSVSNVLVQPGRSDLFNDYRFPSKLPEFLAMGIPVILPASNIGRFLTHRLHAYVLSDANAENIAEAVKEILKDEYLYRALSLGGQQFAADYLAWDKNINGLANFYEQVCLR